MKKIYRLKTSFVGLVLLSHWQEYSSKKDSGQMPRKGIFSKNRGLLDHECNNVPPRAAGHLRSARESAIVLV
jgi:hypothetical protein